MRWCRGYPLRPERFQLPRGAMCATALGSRVNARQQTTFMRFVSDAELLLRVHLFNVEKTRLTDSVFFGLVTAK